MKHVIIYFLLVCMIFLVLIALRSKAVDFPTNKVTQTIDIATAAGANYDDFKVRASWEELGFAFTFEDSGTGVDYSGWSALFRVSKRTSAGDETNVLELGTSAITISSNVFTFGIARTNIAAIEEGAYRAELLLTNSGVVRPLARGQIHIVESLFP